MFVRDVAADVADDGNIRGITISIVNAGLGPALNVTAEIKSDVSLPGTAATLHNELFSQISIIQVLPNAQGNLQGNLSVTVTGDSAVIDLSRAQVLPSEFAANAANAHLAVAPRPDGQTSLRLDALRVSKAELENALSDALFQVSCTSMTNRRVTYQNRPKRSETLRRIEALEGK